MNKTNEKIKSKFLNKSLDAIFIVLGAYLVSLGINMFLLPHKMTTGGVSGIATILYYLFDIPMGISILFINLPLFLISLYKLGVKFSFKTVISTILMSIFLELFSYDALILNNPIDLFTSCVFGGLIVGLGLSLVLKAGASTGGSDLLAQIIYKVTKIQSLSNILLVIEMIIILSIMIVFKDLNIGLYSIIALFISTKVIDIIFTGVDYIKVVTIITKKSDKVIEPILKDLKRGATITNSIGAHSGEEITTITCIITRPQMAKIKEIIRENDSNAIMYVTTANEASGNGFKNI
ncbi:MAG: YitT family protein [Clostridia bacterium]|nr:YitT family protein [Clostridia bacterium]